DDLRIEVVVEDVKRSLALTALGRDTGADDFREAVHVTGVDPPRGLELLAHRLRPRLGAEDPVAERSRAQHAGLGGTLREEERERGRRGEAVGAEVLHRLGRRRGVAARRWDDGRAEPLAAVVEAEATGEEAVAVRDVENVVRACSGTGE